jgi:hypothetical protein
MPTKREMAEAIVTAYNVTAREFTIPGTTIGVTVTRAPELRGDDVWVWLAITVGGVPIPVSNPFIFVNPPLRRGDDTVDRPLLAFVEMVIDTIKQAVQWRQ